jgi:translation elongation factor EF-1beta
LHNDKEALELRCEEAIKSARADLWAEKQNSVNLRENWSRAKGLQEQLESILDFSADQNNAQVKILNKRYADLSSQHEKTIASVASSSTYDQYGSATNPKHFQELVKQLTINIGETERELKECQERELMAAEEQLSMKIEYSRAFAELAQTKLQLAEQKAGHACQIATIKVEIEKERLATNEARSETIIFQKRLNSLCQSIQSLGLDITSEAVSLEVLVKPTFLRLEIIPIGPEIDLVILWSEIKDNYIVDGVKWGDAYDIQEVELGVSILRMSCTVDESIVALETVTNGIETLDDWVKSVRVMRDSSP